MNTLSKSRQDICDQRKVWQPPSNSGTEALHVATWKTATKNVTFAYDLHISFCCLLFPVLVTSRMTTVAFRAVCFHLAVTSASVNTLHHTFYTEKQEHAMQVYSKISFSSWWQLHTTTSLQQRMQEWLPGYAQWLTGDANHISPAVSQILGVRKEYRTLGFFKKSCTSLLLERLNICDRSFIHSIWGNIYVVPSVKAWRKSNNCLNHFTKTKCTLRIKKK